MNTPTTLKDLSPGQRGVVTALNTHGSMRRRMLDLGLVCDTMVECVGVSPMGDPSAFLIRGGVIALRRRDSEGVSIRLL